MTKAEQMTIRNMIDTIESFRYTIEEIHDRDEATYDSRSERWQDSDKGEAFCEMVESLDDAMQALDEAKDYLEEAIRA